jgi:hypothetical protein
MSNETKKITADDILTWELESLADAIGNSLPLDEDFLSRYCGKKIADQLRRIPESDREYILASHIGEGHHAYSIPTESDNEILLPVGEVEFQFEGNPEDVFDDVGEFYISENLAYVSSYAAAFPVDVAALRQEIDEFLSSQFVDDIADEFVGGCFRAMIFTGQFYDSPESEPRPIDDEFSFDDIPRDIVNEIRDDCMDFLGSSAFMVANDPKKAGIDFHLTRNRHGAGFWDGDWPEYGEELTARSRPYGSAELAGSKDGIELWH